MHMILILLMHYIDWKAILMRQNCRFFSFLQTSKLVWPDHVFASQAVHFGNVSGGPFLLDDSAGT